jgi:hypothetical protein
MNAKQRTLLQVGIAVAAIMGIFPPWTDSFFLADESTQLHSQGSAGYSFIFNPPKAQMLHTITIDGSQLFVQWIVVALAVGCGLLFLREPSKK